jgi:hypothetical protein
MGADLMDYAHMALEALRQVPKMALQRVAEQGLPGSHYLYISFLTRTDGVTLPDFLRQRYPDEMTIVLQHQFWGLEVTEDHFAVTLAFNGRHERLSIPFSAVTAFSDPSVPFGLQFRGPVEGETEGTEEAASTPPQSQDLEGISDSPSEGERKTGEVVTLEQFRKK